ncbi:MAG: 5-formyltetrahydrofolate cyclo-ligase [Bacillariaceae sp.]|jgi:5-formyltetrahydrofolate cyclo-ligase
MELFVVLILVTINLLILTQVNVSLVYCFVQQTGFRAREIGKPSRSCAPVVSDDGGKIFDEESYEKDRLAKDAKAMDAMKAVADVELNKKGNDKQQQQLRSPWKWALRKRIWDYMEENDIARFPRPVHHRIPNFVGADLAAKRLIQLPEFQSANIIKVNPDTPQRPVRHFVLEQGKTLLTPQPRLRTGFFSTIQMKELPSLVEIEQCTNSKGVVKYGTPITLNEEYKVDLVVVGSTAVCPRTGARVGKGEGFAELEWGILSAQGNLNAETCLVVTTVHDCQVIENEQDMPEGWALTKHDVPVDIIVTPTRTIQVSNRLPKPSGIFWNLLSPQKLAAIRVLRQLKQETEKKLGEVLPSGPEELLPPLAARNSKKKNSGNNKSGKKQRQPQRPATK